MNNWNNAITNPPTVQDEYLVTWRGQLGGKNIRPLLDICEWSPDDKWIVDDIEARGFKNVVVTGWQHLPEPYDDFPNSSMMLIEAYMKARENAEDIYRTIEFECPICHGKAKGCTEKSMQHIRVVCENCEMRIMS